MNNTAKASIKEYGSLVIVGAVLLTTMLVVRRHAESLSGSIAQHPRWGLFFYLLLNIVDSVVAPGATLPLIPVAARTWGRIPAALATTAGWTAGALVAFLIARQWGAPIVRKITSMQRVRGMKQYIPEDLFWSIVLVRMVFPMDVISYVLGLFTNISWFKYVLASAMGLTPSAFILAWFGKLPNAYGILMFGIGAGVVAASMFVARRKRRPAPARTSSRRRQRAHAGT